MIFWEICPSRGVLCITDSVPDVSKSGPNRLAFRFSLLRRWGLAREERAATRETV